MAQLGLHTDELKAAGLQLVALGLGRPEHAQHACGELAPEHICLVDDTNDSYYAWGVQRGTLTDALANSVNVLRASVKAMANGHTQGRATGDIQMMPATFIVDTNGIIRYAYYGKYAGDDPEIAELVAAARAVQEMV